VGPLLAAARQVVEAVCQLADLKATFREEVRVQLADRLYHLSRSRQERPDAFTSAEKNEMTS
ncbi:MAG TPA: hypothetical protein P5563_13290, partial [Saprospiraceae bacterium]|nr:hypothetical protein [Saprospiraceae bacterium]